MIDENTAYELISLTQVMDKKVRSKFLISLIENSFLDLYDLRGKSTSIETSAFHIKRMIGGKYHRLDGPAYERFFDAQNKQIYEQNWRFLNFYHRIGGPAYILFNSDKQIARSCYYLFGQEFTKNEYFNIIGQ